MTPASRLHSMAGSPQMPGCDDHPASCVVCASTQPRTTRYESWQGSAFTNQDKLRGHGLSDRVCEPCVWAHSWVAPPDKPPNPPGTKGLNLRLFSHFWSERGGYVSLNKANKAAMRTWLRARTNGERWWACIADTGQKHIIPWVREQRRARGVIRFEERDVVMGDWALVDAMTAALTAGVTKAEIESHGFTPRAWELARPEVETLIRLAVDAYGSGWWALSIWLAQRDEDAVATRLAAAKETKAAKAEKAKANGRSATKRSSKGGSRSARVGDTGGVPEVWSERAGPLEPPARPDDRGSADQREHRAAGDDVPADAPPRSSQLGLFG